MGSSETATTTMPNETFSTETTIPTGQNAMTEQSCRQPQTTATPLQTTAAGPDSSPSANIGTSSSATQRKEIIQNPWHLTSQETMPGFSTDGIPGSVSDLDFMMMDTVCADGFQGVEDLSFLNELF